MNRLHLPKFTSLPSADKRNIGNAVMHDSSPKIANGTSFVPLDRFFVNINLLAAADAVDRSFFVAPRACQVLSITENHATAGGTSAAVTPKKCTGTQAASAGTALTAAAIDLTTTAETPQTPALSATAAALVLAAGNRIALDFSGTISPLAQCTITIELRML